MEKLELLCVACGIFKWYSHLDKQVGTQNGMVNREFAICFTPSYIPKQNKDLNVNVYNSIVHDTQKSGNNPDVHHWMNG